MLDRLLSYMMKNDLNVDQPDVRSGHKSIKIGPYIVIWGGYNNKVIHKVFNELWFYHVFFKTWKKVELPKEYPKTALSSSISFYNGKIYLFGGTGYPFANEKLDYIITYEIETQKWNIIGELDPNNKNCPSHKYSHSMSLYNKKLYIFGGTNGFEQNNELNIFDIVKNEWISVGLSDFGITPPKCYRHESFVYDDM